MYVVYGSKTLPATIDAADIPLAFIGTFDFTRIELADLVDVTGDQLDDVIVYVSGQSVRLVTSADSDGDTFSGTAGDCIDSDKTVWPGAADGILDNLDNDCDGAIDENYDFFPEIEGRIVATSMLSDQWLKITMVMVLKKLFSLLGISIAS